MEEMWVMPDTNRLLLFMAMAYTLIVIPGPAVLYIIAKTIEQGFKAGFVSVAGIGLGAVFHVIAAAIGISAILMASPTAFSVLKYLGAFYLLYLGFKKALEKQKPNMLPTDHKQHPLRKVFFEGVLVNVLNPKAAIFFLAFLPQFVNIDKGGTTSQIIVLGLIFIGIALMSNTLYVLISGWFSQWIRKNQTVFKSQKYIVALIYILLGVITLAVKSPS